MKNVSGERVPGRGNSLGEGPEAGKRVAVMFLKRKKDLRNTKKTSNGSWHMRARQREYRVEVVDRHELKQT